jgi:hypothetical protein
MMNHSDLTAQNILDILRDYTHLYQMDLTLDEFRDIAEFIKALSHGRTVDELYKAFEWAANDYDCLTGYHDRFPLEVSEQDCDNAFDGVKWHMQELAEEVCTSPYSFFM